MGWMRHQASRLPALMSFVGVSIPTFFSARAKAGPILGRSVRSLIVAPFVEPEGGQGEVESALHRGQVVRVDRLGA